MADLTESALSPMYSSMIHHIFSFMDTREVIQTSILSNNWRYLWLSTPDLNFDLHYWLHVCKSQSWRKKRDKFKDFVEKVLNTRGHSNIFKFRLYIYNNVRNFELPLRFDLPRVSKWMIWVLACNVQHLVLEFPLGTLTEYDWSGFKLPIDLFAKSVKTLEISFCHKLLIPLPDICRTSLIKNLRLHGIKLPEGNASGEVIWCCNVLEDLMIDYCYANHLRIITISAPLLEKMHVRLYIKRKKAHNGKKVAHKVEIKTYAKNLKALCS